MITGLLNNYQDENKNTETIENDNSISTKKKLILKMKYLINLLLHQKFQKKVLIMQ